MDRSPGGDCMDSSPGEGCVDMSPGEGYVDVSPGEGYVDVLPGESCVDMSPGEGCVDVSPVGAVWTCRLVRECRWAGTQTGLDPKSRETEAPSFPGAESRMTAWKTISDGKGANGHMLHLLG